MTSQESLIKFGFKFGKNGAHSSRTMMLAEITELFKGRDAQSTLEDYLEDVTTFNVLSKPTDKARKLTFRHMTDLYGMSNEIPLFRVFRRLWESDEQARPVLACQMALARDPLLQITVSKILELNQGEPLPREDMEAVLAAEDPERFSPASLKSFAQNVNGTWTNAGYLTGRNRKYRSAPVIRPINVAFALLLGYLQGLTGNRLFSSDVSKVLESRQELLLELARTASHMGLINFKHSSDVVEVTFPNYLTKEEESWINE
ncbi:hypothetical protein [Paraglaciecola sp. 20A4]|uniref:hypothetical protein n=1 Tax=Paraglaciecola sp. 20A4 TaxID=2687288 RepID=UPI00140750ED|nr:hypothetical protein [Paraglaciecola sp. 20A4]